MVLEIRSDIEGKYFEVCTKNKRFGGYPGVCLVQWSNTLFVPIRKTHWYEDLEAIASWVNNELKEECEFAIG